MSDRRPCDNDVAAHTTPPGSLRAALVERWFDIDDEHHEPVTDEQILARIEDLVGEGWHHAGREMERADALKSLLARTFNYPRLLSIGSIHNTIEVRVSRELYEEFLALGAAPTAVGSDG